MGRRCSEDVRRVEYRAPLDEQQVFIRNQDCQFIEPTSFHHECSSTWCVQDMKSSTKQKHPTTLYIGSCMPPEEWQRGEKPMEQWNRWHPEYGFEYRMCESMMLGPPSEACWPEMI